MDAYAHAVEVGSRTLGIDPLRLNADVLSRWKAAPVLGVFVKQPARLARLAWSYIANKQPGKLAALLGMTALVGGNAAIPEDVKEAWRRLDPASLFETMKLLDQVNVARRLTGFDASDKVSWSIAFPLMASVSPLVESVQQLPGKIENNLKLLDEAAALPDLSWEELNRPENAKIKHKLTRATVGLINDYGMLIKSRLAFGLPVSWIGKGATALQQDNEGTMPAWMFSKFKKNPFAKRIDYPTDQMTNGSLTPFMAPFVPGQPNEIKDAYNAELERVSRKAAGQVVDPEQQAYVLSEQFRQR